ncbi:MAG TPA: hypothetical protein DCR21_06400 [Succinivibrionaceae bacterium]|nr:hypothetical protein [Succinivibrionaceae bacterium]
MKTLTKDEFTALTETEQARYINALCAANHIDPPYLTIADEIVDKDSGEVVEDLFDYALDLNIEATDLRGKVFAD